MHTYYYIQHAKIHFGLDIVNNHVYTIANIDMITDIWIHTYTLVMLMN